ncbi:hypothetical protein Pcinc_031369 [Petrolisthes cinctipes]|uniref:Uncharacterized protein n=1 Tax=Petrolisthes cinctipes TaxID=88211 RepID=A0AAE1EWH2_PETCI|nr:hypothetical protein Pcinc_031369 [Petrolisthes cinctipes]
MVVAAVTLADPDGGHGHGYKHVDYTADHYKGYVAKVSYYGKAKHPKHYGPAITFKHEKGYGHGHGGHGHGGHGGHGHGGHGHGYH